MKYTTLPNDRRIAIISKFTALELYKEIYEDDPYLQAGMTICPGDVVIDIGGNIGLWSLFILEQVPQIRLITVEPIPQIFEVLQENLQAHQPPESSVTVLNVGLAEEEKKAEFNFYPRADADSTATPLDFDLLVQNTLAITEKGSLNFLPSKLRTWGLQKMFRWMYSPQKVECQLKTLSQIIEEYQLECIDFIKLDAENAEREVLAGIAEKDWSKIRQLAIEAHTNIPGGDAVIDQLTNLLQAKGYTITMDYHSRFSEIGVHMMYAKRPSQ